MVVLEAWNYRQKCNQIGRIIGYALNELEIL